MDEGPAAKRGRPVRERDAEGCHGRGGRGWRDGGRGGVEGGHREERCPLQPPQRFSPLAPPVPLWHPRNPSGDRPPNGGVWGEGVWRGAGFQMIQRRKT